MGRYESHSLTTLLKHLAKNLGQPDGSGSRFVTDTPPLSKVFQECSILPGTCIHISLLFPYKKICLIIHLKNVGSQGLVSTSKH